VSSPPSSSVLPASAGPARLADLLSLAWPMVLARSTQAVIGFCDALMVAPLGQDALAATTTGAMNAFSVAILPMGVVFIVQSFAAQLTGKGDLVGARRYAWYGLILSAVTAVFGLLAIPLIGPVLGLLPFAPPVEKLMTEYLAIRLLSLGAMVGTEALGNWFGGLGNTRIQMIAGVVAMVVNVALNWVLIGGHLGAPALGVAGAALASAIASCAGFAVVAFAFARGWGGSRPPRGRDGRLALARAELARVLRFGLPNGLNWFLEFAAFIVFINVVMADLGTGVLAAFMVVMSINSVSFMPAFGLSSSGAILAGQAIGAGRKDDVPGIWLLTARTTAVWQCAVGLAYVLAPAVLISIFAPPDQDASQLIEVGAVLLAISAAWQLFDAVAITLSETLRAAGDTAWTLWARIILAWVFFIPASLLSVYVLDGGHVAAMLCVAGYIAVLAAVFYLRFRSGGWRNIDLTGTTPALLPD
jgi:MATE family multidrug resistance protein